MKRSLLTGLIQVATLTLTTFTMIAATPLQEVKLKDIDGKDTSLKAYSGKVLLVVNVASQCGLTPQYKQLESLYKKYHGQGLEVLGFPCNQFGAQEPGTADEIKSFCSTKYSVSFPLFAKLNVNPPEQHPLYSVLSGKEAAFPGPIEWNFGKFLVDKNGQVIARFEPATDPTAEDVVKAIEAALAAK